MKKLASGFASVGACVLRRVGIIKFPPPRDGMWLGINDGLFFYDWNGIACNY